MSSNEEDRLSLEALQEENRRLKRAVEELSVLNELARSIGASINAKEIMDTIIRRALRSVGAEQGVVALVAKQPNDTIKTVARAMVTSSERRPLHLNQSLLGWMYLNEKPLLINDLRSDERFQGLKTDQAVTSILCVPLMTKSELKGVLAVYNKKGGGGFTEEDERLLGILAAQSAQIVENARLYEEEKAHSLLKQQIQLVSGIQTELLPKTSPDVPGYDIAGRNIPAQTVGGDYFDFIPVEPDQMCVCLGDVSGKGLPASLLMANLQATLRGQTHRDTNPSDCLKRCNSMLYRSTDPEHFATLFCGSLDVEKHSLRYCNAGHNYPFLFSVGKDPLRLETGGIVLGIMEQYPFEQGTVDLSPGDLLVIFSDGITEAINADEVEFGEDKLAELLAAHREDSASELIERTVKAVVDHAAGHPQADDMTMVVLRRLAT
jgi:sigma-B regulation protein RsbU (phosphoserine phosphatase)